MVKPRENRVPIMMSEDELKAIDDWRFTNRVATRSEAVRRLCQIGLATDNHLQAVVNSAIKAFNRHMETIPFGVESPPGTVDEMFDWLIEYQRKILIGQLDVHERLTGLLHLIDMVAKPVAALKGNADFDDAKLESLALKAKAMSDALSDKLEIFELRKKAGLLSDDQPEKDAEA